MFSLSIFLDFSRFFSIRKIAPFSRVFFSRNENGFLIFCRMAELVQAQPQELRKSESQIDELAVGKFSIFH